MALCFYRIKTASQNSNSMTLFRFFRNAQTCLFSFLSYSTIGQVNNDTQSLKVRYAEFTVSSKGWKKTSCGCPKAISRQQVCQYTTMFERMMDYGQAWREHLQTQGRAI